MAKVNLPEGGLIRYCVIILSLLIGKALSWKVRHYDFDVEYMYRSPDCVQHVVMGINGQFPSPTIRANAGDTVVVRLTNKLHTEGVVIHWHGIRQVLSTIRRPSNYYYYSSN